jgi:hypothetical protein
MPGLLFLRLDRQRSLFRKREAWGVYVSERSPRSPWPELVSLSASRF